MNIRTLKKLTSEGMARLHWPEWLMFLKICETYLKAHKIKNPIVVSVGQQKDNDKDYYEQVFEAEYITAAKLRGRAIDILSIGGGSYEEVRKNFEAYSPLCSGIIVIHDIESCRYKKRKAAESWKFWDELKLKTAKGEKKYEDFLFLAIHKKRIRGNQRGIGVIIKS